MIISFTGRHLSCSDTDDVARYMVSSASMLVGISAPLPLTVVCRHHVDIEGVQQPTLLLTLMYMVSELIHFHFP